MATLQDKLEDANIKIRHILFDNQIRNMGMSTRALRLKLNINKYGDTTEKAKVILQNFVDCVINYPGDVPLMRERADETTETTSGNHIFLFDILPIDIYTKWEDNIERYDFIIHKVKNEVGDYTKFVLKIT